MAELVHQERLQPSLLDRLTDDEPGKRVESRDQRVLSLQRLREGILRDLTWLFNSGNLADVEDLEELPEVSHSVLNYGVPDLTGRTASGADLNQLERLVRQAVWDFEPRILKKTVKVRAVTAPEGASHNTLAFEIEGEMWAQPLPLHLYLRTEVDLEAGSVSVAETRGPGAP